MTVKELARYDVALRELAARVRGEVTGLRDEAFQGPTTEEVGAAGAPARQADPGSYEAAEGVTIAVLGQEEHLLAEIDAALERVARKSFGRCEGCQKVIPRARLNALPYARYCVACARRHEQQAAS